MELKDFKIMGLLHPPRGRGGFAMTLLMTSLISLFSFMHPVFGAERAGDQGFGVELGRPTALTGKIWLDNQWALEGVLGVASSELDVHLVLLYHDFGMIRNSKSASQFFDGLLKNGEVPVYFGVGPRVLFEDKSEVGLRFPVGLGFMPAKSPWEFFAEFAPILRLTPSVGFNGDFGLGVRYYFKAIRAAEAE